MDLGAPDLARTTQVLSISSLHNFKDLDDRLWIEELGAVYTGVDSKPELDSGTSPPVSGNGMPLIN